MKMLRMVAAASVLLLIIMGAVPAAAGDGETEALSEAAEASAVLPDGTYLADFETDSSMFTVELTDTQVIFHTKGFGHGVGMSQAGANGMAADGADYKTILTHYYTGVSIGVIGQY